MEPTIEGFNDYIFTDGGAIPYMKELFANHLPDQVTSTDIKKSLLRSFRPSKKPFQSHWILSKCI